MAVHLFCKSALDILKLNKAKGAMNDEYHRISQADIRYGGKDHHRRRQNCRRRSQIRP
ncbi:protein of unknown function [Paenibacillus alvei]|uniref:Uncharacterized protein n=1 Tax=Paenibacillus alvei TaxID=44250 RepID=A0A383RKK9_PAEAL|nr:protein of unknown function [Paenibacillus alvei]